MTTFKELGISPWLTSILESLSITTPSDIQAACIPPILAGKNVVGNAKTGSGKTAAFALPIIQKLADDMYGPYALVLTPTRELAFQIAEQFRALGSGINLRESVVVGGMDMVAQGLELQKRPHILIGTPGRLVDHLNSGSKLNLRRIKFLVLDEADRLLHPTFSEDLERLFGELPSTRQTLLFSATMTKSIEALIGDAAGGEAALKNVFVHRSSEKYEANKQLEQKYIFVSSVVKEANLVWLMKNDFKDKSVIIFTSRCRTCALMLALLQNFGIRCTALHGFMTQNERVGSLAKFKSNVVDVLLATDVGSRGLDIPKVQVVVNFDVPASATDYIHRVGRTARAGRGGMALSIVCERDVNVVLNIEEKVGQKLEKHDVPEGEVAKIEFLNEVNVAKREALLHLEETGFGTKQEINMKKKRALEEEDEQGQEGKSATEESSGSEPPAAAVSSSSIPSAPLKQKPKAVAASSRPATKKAKRK